MGVFDNKVAYADYRDSNVRVTRPFIVTPVADGVSSATTHDLFTIPDGYALVGGAVIVKTTLADTTSIKFQVNGTDLTGAVGVANLAAGDVISLEYGMQDTTDGTAGYANGSDITFDMVVVGAITAGKFLVILDLVHVDAIS